MIQRKKPEAIIEHLVKREKGEISSRLILELKQTS